MLEFINNYIDWDMLIKLFIAIVMSAIIGLEREEKGHPAGLRTHILVGVTAALLVAVFQGFFLGDGIARMAAAIMTGIGFLGAGTIIVYGKHVRGLTTAASIWAVAGLGIVIGLGYFFEAIVVTAVFWAVLHLKHK